jgi:hypothetical protein
MEKDLIVTIPPGLKVGRTSEGFCVRIEGRGTSRESPAVLGLFIVQILDDADCTVVIDLKSCEYLDGKFLDSLVDLQRHYGSGQPPRFVITAPPEVCSRLFSPFCPDIPRDVVGDCPEVIGEESSLPPWESGTVDLDLHLMRWHQQLARLGEHGRTDFERLAGPLLAGSMSH